MDNTPGDKLGVWRDMRLADALVIYFVVIKLKVFAYTCISHSGDEAD